MKQHVNNWSTYYDYFTIPVLQLCVQEEMKEKHKKELQTVEVNSK